VEYGKCGVLQFGGNNLRNGTASKLRTRSIYNTNRKSHTGNRMMPFVGAYTTIASARNRVRNPSNSAIHEIGCHGYRELSNTQTLSNP